MIKTELHGEESAQSYGVIVLPHTSPPSLTRTGVGERWSHMTFGTPNHELEVLLLDLVSFEIFKKNICLQCRNCALHVYWEFLPLN